MKTYDRNVHTCTHTQTQTHTCVKVTSQKKTEEKKEIIVGAAMLSDW